MPSTDRVRSFITRLEQQDYAAAIMHFFHPDATSQQNFGAVREGRDAIVAHQMEAVLRYGSMAVRKVERFAINGNVVFINWQADLDVPGSGKRLLDGVSMPVWDGDRVRSERMYFDPAQLRPAQPA